MSLSLSNTLRQPLLWLATAVMLSACGDPDAPADKTEAVVEPPVTAKESVRVSLFSWPGYGFWFIAKEKNLVPELDLDIRIIEDPYESFGLMSAGQLDITSSTVEYGPIAVDKNVPIKLVTYTNPSFGTDKIILRPEIASPAELVGTDACPGPYRVVRGFLPREVWDAQRREAGIADRERQLSSRAAAEADYAADMARVAELRAWRDGMMLERGDIVAQIWVDENQGTAHMFHTDGATREALVPAALQPHVTAQIVPQGGNALSEARDAIATQMGQAALEGDIYIEPIGGYVGVRVRELEPFSQAAVAGNFTVPPLVRLEMDNQSAIYRQDLPIRSDPDAIWYPLEAHPDFSAIRELVAGTPIMRPEPPRPGETEDRWVAQKPSKAGSLQQTHFLIAFGRTLREIQTLRAAGFDPIGAQEDMNGRQTVETRALVASDVVVAEPVGIDIADTGPDGYSSSVRWRVIEVLKGSADVGNELRQRLASGVRTDEAGVTRYGQAMEEPVLLPGLPDSLEPGSRWLLHLSDLLYRHAAYVQGGEGAARTEGKWFVTAAMPPARIEADGMVRPLALYPEPMPLDELRAAIAPIQAALVEAGLVGEQP